MRSRVAACGLRRPPGLGFEALGPAASLTLRRCPGAGQGQRLPGVRSQQTLLIRTSRLSRCGERANAEAPPAGGWGLSVDL